MSRTIDAPAASRSGTRPRLARGTIIGGVVGALLAVFATAPIAAAVVMLRCCDDSQGPDRMAWVVMGAIVVLVGLLGAAVGGAIAAGLARLAARMR